MSESYYKTLPPERYSEFTKINDWDDFLKIREPDNKNNSGPIIFEKLVFEKSTVIKGVKSPLIFAYCFFLEDVEITGDFESIVTIANSFADRNFTLKGVNSTGIFSIHNLGVLGEMVTINCKFRQCNWHFLASAKIHIEDSSFDRIVIDADEGQQLRAIKLSLEFSSGELEVNTKLHFIDVIYFEVHKLSSKVKLRINNLNVSYFNLVEVRNDSLLRINGLSAKNGILSEKKEKSSVFNITESYLGKAEFLNVDLTMFGIINIVNSYLVDVTFVNVKWAPIVSIQAMNKLRLEVPDSAPRFKTAYLDQIGSQKNADKKFAERNREIYRQIKLAYSKQGDSVSEQIFHAYEMRSLNGSLSWSRNFMTKIVLKLSFVFSNFGQSLARPLVGLLLGNFVLLQLALLTSTIPKKHSFLYEYLYFINPLHKIDEINNAKGLLFDTVIRIWVSYMLYNFIRASRRFIK